MNTQQLKEKILQLAIQGKLVKQDLNDEPVTEILKRIKQEKEQLIKEKKIKKTKELPPIGEDEKPFDIPEMWEWVRLGETTFNHGQKKPDSTFTYIDVGSIDNKNCRLSEDITNLMSGEAPSRARKLIKFGSVIYSTVRPYLMNIAIIDREFDLEPIVSTGFAVLHPHSVLNNRFLYFYLRSCSFNDYVSNQMVGMAYPAINEKNLLMGLFPLPPLEEQQRIVDKIDQLFALIDTLEGNKEEMLAAIKETRNKVLDEAIRGNLVEQDPNNEPAKELLKRIKKEKEQLIKDKKIKKTKELPYISDDEKPFDIPDSWEWVRLGEIGQIVGGGTPKTGVKEYWENAKIPWLTPADFKGFKGKFISSGRRNISELGLTKSSTKLMPKGTVLFSSRAPIGYTAIASNEIATNQGFKSCIPFIMGMNNYIYNCFKYFGKIINENASGTTFKEVSGAEISNLTFPIPPIEEQRRIVKKIDTIMTICDDLESQINN